MKQRFATTTIFYRWMRVQWPASVPVSCSGDGCRDKKLCESCQTFSDLADRWEGIVLLARVHEHVISFAPGTEVALNNTLNTEAVLERTIDLLNHSDSVQDLDSFEVSA